MIFRRAKARTVVTRLEKSLGIPKQPSHLPAPLDILIATILSQNTNDKNSHRAYTGLRNRCGSWEEVADTPVRVIAGAIRSGGMADQKSLRIKNILHEIREQFGRCTLDPIRRWSDERIMEKLTRYSGVGPKTASCVLLFSLGRDIFPVDTHVHRICSRLQLSSGARTPEETFRQMGRIVPEGKRYSFHTNLIRFGRTICRSSRPRCGDCPLNDQCSYQGKTRLRIGGPPKANHHFMLLDNVSA
ncbi:MAG: endonuclease III [Bacteroidota bacterium]